MANLQIGDIRKIAELLKQGEESSSDSEDDICGSRRAPLGHAGPGDVGVVQRRPGDVQAIWQPGEVEDGTDTALDPRPQPHYEMLYRQCVGAEDVFLQLGHKTPATASCEALLIRVALPGDSRHDVDLQVTRDKLTVRSPRHFLELPLPHRVHPDSARASWEPGTSRLAVTVAMDRELDFLKT